MSQCKFEQFRAIAHPSQSRDNVRFCPCKVCTSARWLLRRGTRLEQCGERMRPRLEALRWTAPEPVAVEQTEDETATET